MGGTRRGSDPVLEADDGDDPPLDTRDWSRLLALGVLWGGSFFFVEIALADLPPLTVVLARVALAALALHALLLATGTHAGSGIRLWRRYAAMGLLNNVVPFTLIVWAQTTVTGGLASILNATTPLFTVILAHALTPQVTNAANGNRYVGFTIR